MPSWGQEKELFSDESLKSEDLRTSHSILSAGRRYRLIDGKIIANVQVPDMCFDLDDYDSSGVASGVLTPAFSFSIPTSFSSLVLSFLIVGGRSLRTAGAARFLVLPLMPDSS